MMITSPINQNATNHFATPRATVNRTHWWSFQTLITVRNEVAKVMFLHRSVCPQGGLPQCMLRYHPPGPGTPLRDQAAPPPGPGTLPDQAHPPGPGTPSEQTATAADGTHPTGMHSCLLMNFLMNVYVLLCLRVQNRRKKWNFPLNFRTMRKLSELYSGIFQTQSSGCVSGLDHIRNFTNLKILNI